MAWDKAVSRLFLPDDESWLKHANPWSVWTRFATLPFIILALWSRIWIGWYCLLPLSALIFWVWINPTLFGKPQHYNSWGSKAVLGERILVGREERPIAKHHRNAVRILNVLQTVGGLILIYGLWNLDLQITLHGTTFVYLSKMWFLDRMVWLYEDSEDAQII